MCAGSGVAYCCYCVFVGTWIGVAGSRSKGNPSVCGVLRYGTLAATTAVRRYVSVRVWGPGWSGSVRRRRRGRPGYGWNGNQCVCGVW